MSSPPSRNVEAHPVIDLATITVEAAEKLAGRDVLAVVPVDVPPWPHGPWFIYDTFARVGVARAGAEVPERSAWLRGETGQPRVIVRGRVEVIRHQAAVHHGQRFDAFLELRFTEQ